jgi:hypothetical protein
MRGATALALRNGDQEKLARIASSRAAEAGLARRASIVLLAAEGLPPPTLDHSPYTAHASLFASPPSILQKTSSGRAKSGW